MKHLAVALLVFSSIWSTAQKISSSRWRDLFSYNNVLSIREDNGKLIAATENGIFFYTPATGEITKLSKANGLHQVKITAFDFNPETKTGLVGYGDGSMDVLTQEGIFYIVDIPIATGFNGSKKINHISITGNQALISVDYGVSIFNFDKREFGDTAFFNNNGQFEPSLEAILKDKTVFAITPTGLKKHDLDVKFNIYSDWGMVASGSFTNIDIDNGLIAYGNNNQVWYGDGINFSGLENYNQVQDIAVLGKAVVVTDEITATNNGIKSYNSSVSVYQDGQKISQHNYNEDLNTAFYNGKIFAGSRYKGLLDENSRSYKPDGPYSNVSYKINLLDDKIWVSTGSRQDRYNKPLIHSDNLGFYFFNGKNWVYPSFFKNTSTVFNVLDAIGVPSNYKDTFITNYTMQSGQGFYRFLYDETRDNFDLKYFYPTDSSPAFNRPVGFAFDDKNNLFASAAFYPPTSSSGLYSFDLPTTNIFSTSLITVAAAQKPIYYDKMIWYPMARANYFAVIDYNGTANNFSDDKVYLLSSKNNLPASAAGTLSVAIDKNGDAWIGSDRGLRTLSNASTEIKNNPQLESIIITQNGLAEELFKDSAILQIEVDGGNQKWVSVEGGGVFYLNANGQQTILNFNEDNSPLPSNVVTDIKVDQKNGDVYFVTYEGIVVYQSDIKSVSENFGNVVVYPNPVVSSQYKGSVHFKGLAEKTNIRIVDVAGNLVHQSVARGGVYEWDLTNKGKRVASGIYFVLMTNADGTDKATAKIAVVN